MRRCSICDKYLGHTHGNRKTCDTCQSKEIERTPKILWVQVAYNDLQELQRKAKVCDEIESLTGEAKEKVNQILKDWRSNESA